MSILDAVFEVSGNSQNSRGKNNKYINDDGN